jgi:hypothetical protein
MYEVTFISFGNPKLMTVRTVRFSWSVIWYIRLKYKEVLQKIGLSSAQISCDHSVYIYSEFYRQLFREVKLCLWIDPIWWQERLFRLNTYMSEYLIVLLLSRIYVLLRWNLQLNVIIKPL